MILIMIRYNNDIDNNNNNNSIFVIYKLLTPLANRG